MKLYNTLTKHLDEVKPSDGKVVKIYSCGPTVYDHSHIGNLSSFIFADTLRRAISVNYKVIHAMNFTDVDDKTIRRSRAEGTSKDPKENLKVLTERYGAIFLEDMASIGADVAAIKFIKATESIEEMQELIKQLHTGGFAYVADDGVYFSIKRYREAGKKYGQLLSISEASTSEARIQNDEYDKDSAHDFALWKVQKEGEPAWEFSLEGNKLDGRPGWHIECSAMSASLLGQPFDIHTGGIDLIFPHHENEIAQSTALAEVPYMATIFAHNGHLFIDGKKMSKSLNNFYTLEDIKNKGFEPLAFRLMVLQSHYRSEANFTWEALGAAQNRLKSFENFADLLFQNAKGNIVPGDYLIKAFYNISDALLDDLNTPEALKLLNQAIDYVMGKGKSTHGLEDEDFKHFLASIDRVLGLKLTQRQDITPEQKQLIANREKAREEKEWAKSDKLRAQLEEQGIAVRDTETGTIWSHL